MVRRAITVVLIALVAVVAMDSLAGGTSFVTSATSGPRSLNVKTYKRGASVTIWTEVTDGAPSAYLVQDYWTGAYAGEGCENESPVLVRCPYNKPNVWVTLDGRRSMLRLFGDLRTRVTASDGAIVLGGDGEDSVAISSGWADGLRGRDVLKGGGAHDLLRGGGNADRILSSAGPDAIDGGSGRDTLIGGPGQDSVVGGSKGDVMRSGAGDDEVTAMDGHADRLVDCGPGHDVAIVDRLLDGNIKGCEKVRFHDPDDGRANVEPSELTELP